MNQINLPTTGDRVLDTLLTYAILDIGLEVDPEIKFEVTFGRETFLSIKSKMPGKKLGERMLLKLGDNSRRFSIADKLNFFVNIGNMSWSVKPFVCIYCMGKSGCNFHGYCGKTNIPAYAVFSGYIDKAMKHFSFPWNPKPLSKTVSKKERDLYYATLYVGVSPYWSKGLKVWDKGKWTSPSTYILHPILPLAYYGLANYAINTKVNDMLTQLMFSPPIGRTLLHSEAIKLLALVRRIINIINLEMHEIFRLALPAIVLPLSLLCLLDIPAAYMLYQIVPSLLLINYDLGRGCPKNPRGYEEFSLADTLEFYKGLGEHFWGFRRMIGDLINAARREQYRSQIFSILIELALSIKNREPSYLNNALIKVQSLRKEMKTIYALRDAEVLAAHKALSYL